MTPTITAFENSPDRGRGLARDMAVRWALEEVGQAYDVRLVSFAAMKQQPHLALVQAKPLDKLERLFQQHIGAGETIYGGLGIERKLA